MKLKEDGVLLIPGNPMASRLNLLGRKPKMFAVFFCVLLRKY